MIKRIKGYLEDKKNYEKMKWIEVVLNRMSSYISIENCCKLQRSFYINCNDGKTTFKLKPFKVWREN